MSHPPPGAIGPRLIARWALRRYVEAVEVIGVEHVPARGPVLLAARHYHHLLDGAVLIRYVPRTLHVVVGLDWTANARQRRWMERACAWAGWPVILRPRTAAAGGFAPDEIARYLRSGLRDAAQRLREGGAVVVFPEGYPVIDPAAQHGGALGRDEDGLLPFAAGFRTIAASARREGVAAPIVPVGFDYAREGAKWRITARFGAPLAGDAPVAAVEDAVRALSRSGVRRSAGR